ncbi:hypothetical protein N9B57_04090 [Verrucomicrobia bacterium]|jgi:hypothetical protein|nr:hypothetical protein [Verrucomicrobiota bacterium]MDA7511545.1 hypothetical protein [Verrucomicrobiota bacterium]MDA7867098.1 hypothetical protein [Verrucomicrobiota bacterium]
MRIYLDECVPRPLAKLLEGHECRDALQMRWTGLRNGVLLGQVEDEGFDVFLTSDQNLGYQQNLKKLQVAIVVLPTNHWPLFRNSVNRILDILETLQPGDDFELVID